MGIYINDRKVVVITSPKSIRFDLEIEVNKSLNHEIEFIISRNESLTEYKVKNKIS